MEPTLRRLFFLVAKLLNDRQRQVFYLRCKRSMPFQEIARLLGITESAARGIWRLLRQKLRRAMDGKLDDDGKRFLQIIELGHEGLSRDEIALRLEISCAAVDVVRDEVAKQSKEALDNDPRDSGPDPEPGKRRCDDNGCDENVEDREKEDEISGGETDGQ